MEQSFQKKVWISVSLIAGTFAIFGVIFYFLISQLTSTSQKIIADRNDAAERSYAHENLSLLKTQEPEAAQDKQKIDILLPNQDGILTSITYFKSIAQIHQVDLTFTYGAVIVPTAVQPGYYPFSATVSGSLVDMRDFISEIESKTTKFMVNVDSVEITFVGPAYRSVLAGKVFFK